MEGFRYEPGGPRPPRSENPIELTSPEKLPSEPVYLVGEEPEAVKQEQAELKKQLAEAVMQLEGIEKRAARTKLLERMDQSRVYANEKVPEILAAMPQPVYQQGLLKAKAIPYSSNFSTKIANNITQNVFGLRKDERGALVPKRSLGSFFKRIGSWFKPHQEKEVAPVSEPESGFST